MDSSQSDFDLIKSDISALDIVPYQQLEQAVDLSLSTSKGDRKKQYLEVLDKLVLIKLVRLLTASSCTTAHLERLSRHITRISSDRYSVPADFQVRFNGYQEIIYLAITKKNWLGQLGPGGRYHKVLNPWRPAWELIEQCLCEAGDRGFLLEGLATAVLSGEVGVKKRSQFNAQLEVLIQLKLVEVLPDPQTDQPVVFLSSK